MSDYIKTATEDQFYTELINKFFNPSSYFFYCITNCLNRSSLFNNNSEVSTTKFITQFIDFLTKSKKPAQDLKEIAHLKDFEYIYSNLENQLIRYDLRSLDQSQLKKAIQKIALSHLKDIYQILINNENSLKKLAIYIDIKTKLRDLLNGSNGKHSNKKLIKSIEPVSPETSNEAVIQLTNEPSCCPGEDTCSELNIADNTTKTVGPLKNNPENKPGGSFEINTSFNDFRPTSSHATQRIHTASIFSALHANSLKNEANQNEILISGEDDDEELLKLIQEINSDKESLLLKDFAEIEDMNIAGAAILSSKNDLAQENQETEHIDDEEKAAEKAENKNVADADNNKENIFDDSINTIFHQEAFLYYKVLLAATSQLKNEEKIQSALEDIELASSSLKHLAQKFRMEKLALLPELMESICILAADHIIKIPSSIVQGIEDGVILLKEFDVANTDHKTKFLSILTLLKEFYLRTLNTTKQLPHAF